MDGVLIIDKPAGMTSHDVVAQVRRALGERSVGHLGTLDPMATGVLPLLIGRYTRLAQFLQGGDKLYEGTIRFGFATDTYDAEGQPTGPAQSVDLKLQDVCEAAKAFTGRIQQIPPPFSAKKIAGVPAYKLARKGKTPELKCVEVEVREFEIRSCEGALATFQARVTAGTYIRSLAHDLGKALGCGGHLASLRRTESSGFGLKGAVALAALAGSGPYVMSDNGYYVNNKNEAVFLHPREVLPGFPVASPDDATLAKLSHGMAVNLPVAGSSRFVRVFRGQCEVVAICQRIAGSLFQPKVVLCSRSEAIAAR
jgi:tRNA pseudouridine55 synthase